MRSRHRPPSELRAHDAGEGGLWNLRGWSASWPRSLTRSIPFDEHARVPQRMLTVLCVLVAVMALPAAASAESTTRLGLQLAGAEAGAMMVTGPQQVAVTWNDRSTGPRARA